jgi:uncharacterized protein YcbX
VSALGTVTALWRYPVKSLQGESVDTLRVAPGGVVGDRRFAIRDRASGRLVSAKRVERLLAASARTRADGSVAVALPGHEEIAVGDPALPRALGSWLERDVEVVDAGAGLVAEVEMDLDQDMLDKFPGGLRADPGDPTGTMVFSTPGTNFADTSGIHLLGEAAVAAVAARHGASAGELRRFRPNLVVAVDGAFAEDGWIGSDVTIGAAPGAITRPVLRCVVITRAQPGLAAEPGLLRALHGERRGELGVFFVPAAPAEVRVGDEILRAR